MRVNFRSDVTGKEYSGTTEEYGKLLSLCKKEDAEYSKAQEEKKSKEVEAEANLSKLKKRLSKNVEDAETALAEAHKTLDEAKKLAATEVDEANKMAESIISEAKKVYNDSVRRAKDILTESNKSVKEILKPAEEAVRNAEKVKYDAIMQFSKECGSPYQVTYTGERAKKEWEKVQRQFEHVFDDFFFPFLF